MESDSFSTTIEDKAIVLLTAVDATRFSFIVQDSISYLDLELCKISADSGLLFNSLCGSCTSKRLRYFVNTEEKCRKFFAPRRRLLYTQHLDLPKGRECSLKHEDPESVKYCDCCRSPHIGKIELSCGFHEISISNFIEEALKINIPKEKILKCIVKIPFKEVPLLSRLEIQTASKFIDCFYPKVSDFALFKDFIGQFDVTEWMMEFQQPEILEYLLYYARLFGNISLCDEDIECVSLCIFNRCYTNIRPLLNYFSDSTPYCDDYGDYLIKISSKRPSLTEEVMDEAAKSIPVERLCRLLQIIWLYIDSLRPRYKRHASEALRLIWSSIPEECVILEELNFVFGAAFSETELRDIHDFYSKAIGEFHDTFEPRSLTHLCRTVIRRTFQVNNVWIPDGIRRTGLPKSLQSFLNLEKYAGSEEQYSR